MNNPATRVAVFRRGTAGDAIEVYPTKELPYRPSGLSWAAYHPAGLHFFPHCLSQKHLSLGAGQRLVIVYMAPRRGMGILEFASKTGSERLENSCLGMMLDKEFLQLLQLCRRPEQRCVFP